MMPLAQCDLCYARSSADVAQEWTLTDEARRGVWELGGTGGARLTRRALAPGSLRAPYPLPSRELQLRASEPRRSAERAAQAPTRLGTPDGGGSAGDDCRARAAHRAAGGVHHQRIAGGALAHRRACSRSRRLTPPRRPPRLRRRCFRPSASCLRRRSSPACPSRSSA